MGGARHFLHGNLGEMRRQPAAALRQRLGWEMIRWTSAARRSWTEDGDEYPNRLRRKFAGPIRPIQSRVCATTPSVEFSIGTTPKEARSWLTSWKTSAMVAVEQSSADEPNFSRRQMAVGRLGPKEGDPQRRFKRPADPK